MSVSSSEIRLTRSSWDIAGPSPASRPVRLRTWTSRSGVAPARRRPGPGSTATAAPPGAAPPGAAPPGGAPPGAGPPGADPPGGAGPPPDAIDIPHTPPRCLRPAPPAVRSICSAC
ncbi:hypothetical protein DV701_06575 [Ornithinimicrobium avium]|uniref:Uncharacterized protein n=1 Tax=Ornithinimicrobium avium TaxID=2283195 RepID=A0A345NLC9_9MICO|nr:hypothetical protein DV701_06575 [Ornithinimicrobium avium]